MDAAISPLVVVSISILITQVAAIMLAHTGLLSCETTRFQARSAFSGAGFTTTESERVVSYPRRRRIVLVLMLLGNTGIVMLTLGLAALWGIATSPWVNHQLARLIDWSPHRHTRLDIKDYASLLQLSGDYRVIKTKAQPENWMCNKTLSKL